MSRKQTNPVIHVWDPNPFNPYGTEISRVLKEATGARVVHFTRQGKSYSAPFVRSAAVIPASTGAKRSPTRVFKYLIGLIIFFAATATHRPIAIFPWISNYWEALMVCALQLLGIRTVIVVHNPTPERDDVEKIGFLKSARSKASLLAVHSPELTKHLSGKVVVTSHPSYKAWAQSMMQRRSDFKCQRRVHHPNKISAAYVGSVRADKGFYDLPGLALVLDEYKVSLAVCAGIYNGDEVKELRLMPNVEFIGDGECYLTDNQLFDALMNADVVIAPYRDVTVSGSVFLALTVGTPVVAYECQAFSDILPPEFLAHPGRPAHLGFIAARVAKRSQNFGASEWAKMQDNKSIAQWKYAMSLLN